MMFFWHVVDGFGPQAMETFQRDIDKLWEEEWADFTKFLRVLVGRT